MFFIPLSRITFVDRSHLDLSESAPNIASDRDSSCSVENVLVQPVPFVGDICPYPVVYLICPHVQLAACVSQLG